jgi:hypothetical protein
MSSWAFHPIKPTKEAYEQKQFEHAKHIHHILELLSTLPTYQVRGQLVLKGASQDYPDEFKALGHTSLDSSHVYVQFKNLNELKDLLKKIEYKEAKINRIFLYTLGFFLK